MCSHSIVHNRLEIVSWTCASCCFSLFFDDSLERRQIENFFLIAERTDRCKKVKSALTETVVHFIDGRSNDYFCY